MRQYLQDLSPQVQLAVEKFLGVGLSDPVFVQALLLANSRGFGHVLTLQFMAATTATLGPIEWKFLGFPSPARCTALVADLLDLAEALENRRIDCDSPRIACGSLRDVRVYAVIRVPLEVAFTDIVDVLGAATVAERLREFACALRSATMVG